MWQANSPLSSFPPRTGQALWHTGMAEEWYNIVTKRAHNRVENKINQLSFGLQKVWGAAMELSRLLLRESAHQWKPTGPMCFPLSLSVREGIWISHKPQLYMFLIGYSFNEQRRPAVGQWVSVQQWAATHLHCCFFLGIMEDSISPMCNSVLANGIWVEVRGSTSILHHKISLMILLCSQKTYKTTWIRLRNVMR